MIDHTGVMVSDFCKSMALCQSALAPVGYAALLERSAAVTGHTDSAGFCWRTVTNCTAVGGDHALKAVEVGPVN